MNSSTCSLGIVIWPYSLAVAITELAIDAQRLRTVCERYGVARLEVFGSVGRGDATPDSDIDLLYDLASGAGSAGTSRTWPTSWAYCSAGKSTWCLVRR